MHKSYRARSEVRIGGDKKRAKKVYEGIRPLTAEDVAAKASKVPNMVTEEDFSTLRKYFDSEACAEIVGVIALMGFYNRWNDTLATELERAPMDMSFRHLKSVGWEVGKHAIPTKRRGKAWHPEMVNRILISHGVPSCNLELQPKPQVVSNIGKD